MNITHAPRTPLAPPARAHRPRPAPLRLAAALLGALLVALGTALPAHAAAPAWPVLSQGAGGNDVASMQFLLRQRGQNLVAGGSFDARTKDAVVAFQSANGLTADGVVGPNTWGKLVVTVSPGDTQDNAVRAMQFQLQKIGYNVPTDGVFAGDTTTAVNDFKAGQQLTGGSTVGATTWQYLLGAAAGSGGVYGGYAFVVPKGSVSGGRSSLLNPHHDYPAADIPVVEWTDAFAVTSGTARQNGGVSDACGYGLAIDGDDGVTYQYCHLNSRLVATGARVTPGQLVAYTGNTGNTTGPHLHFGIFRGGSSVCPQQLLAALWDGTAPPSPQSLPATGCFY
ncbi:peptidoglycan-binding protein [Kitasatospora indigofera]|uniref:peptidoglycan-binding protein n=1 Tax=Kitasatospora indigofera TaxID=67307 RepID=UPI003679C321